MATKTRLPKPNSPPTATRNAFQFIQIVKVGNERKLLLRERLNMTREVFGRVVDVSPRAIATVEQDEADVPKLVRPYAEVARLYAALCGVVEPKVIGRWFVTPNEAFDGFKPVELIERGEIDRLWDMVYRLQVGMPS